MRAMLEIEGMKLLIPLKELRVHSKMLTAVMKWILLHKLVVIFELSGISCEEDHITGLYSRHLNAI